MASKAAAEELQAKEKVLKDEISKYRGIQSDIAKSSKSKSQLEAQTLENQNVKEELNLLEDGAAVYKLVGPVLVKQDLTEAKQTVQKRLDYIGKEIERYEGIIKDHEKKQDTMAEKLSKLQQDYQQTLVKTGIVR